MYITALAPLPQLDDLISGIYAQGGVIAVVLVLVALGFYFNQRAVAQQITSDAKSRESTTEAYVKRMDLMDVTYREQNEEVKKLRADMYKAVVDYSQQAIELSDARDAIGELNKDIAALKKDGLQKDEAIKDLNGQIGDLKNKMLANQELAKTALDESKMQYNAEKARADGLAVTVTELSKDLDTANGRLKTQEAQIIKLSETVNEQQQTIDSQTGQIDTLGKRVQWLEAENDALRLGKNEQPLPLPVEPIKDEGDKGMR